MLGAAFRFIGELLGTAEGGRAAPDSDVRKRMNALLSECMERTEDGGWRMSVKLADPKALDSLADILARLASRA